MCAAIQAIRNDQDKKAGRGGCCPLPFADLPLRERLRAIEERIRTLDRPPEALSFEWLNRTFLTRLAPSAFGRSTLQLKANLGALPYSIESPTRRREAFALLEAGNRRAEVTCRPGHGGYVSYMSETIVPTPEDRTELYSQLVLVLFEAVPALLPLCRLLHPPPDRR